MAITRSQQAKQMLQDGGMLVSPSKDGKRPGYRNPNEDRAREEAANRREQNRASNYQRSQTFDAPKQSTFSSEVEDEINDKDRDFTIRQLTNNITTDDGKKDKPKKKKDKFLFPSIFNREFMFRAANKLPRFGAATIKDKQNAYKAYLQSMGVDNIPGSLDSDDPFDFFESDAFNYVPSAGDEKFDANIQDYGDFVLEKFGAPAIKFGGNVGNIEVFKKADGTFDYRQKQKDDGPDPIIPLITTPDDTEDDTEDDPTNIFAKAGISPRIAGSLFAAEGGRIGAMDGGMMSPEGGIMDLESGRQMYFLGKLVKKATRAVKKIAKSPIGKAALFAAPFAMSGGSLGAGLGKFFGTGSLNPFLAKSIGGDTMFSGLGSILSKAGLVGKSGLPTLKGGITLASILPLLTGKTDEEKEDILKDYYASQKLQPSQSVRGVGSEFDFYDYNLAEGGMPSKEPVAKKTMPLLDMDGQEMDLRAEGGFVPIGRMEKADDVPARLSKNEFVFTADAVRNAGDGNVDKGAEVMYNMMKNLESGGDVSEESQGLEGAREMFQTSKRLEEVL